MLIIWLPKCIEVDEKTSAPIMSGVMSNYKKMSYSTKALSSCLNLCVATHASSRIKSLRYSINSKASSKGVYKDAPKLQSH